MSLEDYISHGIIIIFVMSCNHRKYRYRSFQTHLNIKRPICKETYMQIMTNTYNLGEEKDWHMAGLNSGTATSTSKK